MYTPCGSIFITPPPAATSVILDLVHERDFYVAVIAHSETSDGREVLFRYENGFLSVMVAKSPGEDCYKGNDVFVSDRVGPWWATVHSAQLCRLVGITINGKTPPLLSISEMRPNARLAGGQEDRCFDLSGETSFFEAWLNGTTLETALEAIRAIRALLPQSQIVRYRRHGSGSFRGADVIENLTEVIDDAEIYSTLDCLIVAGVPPNEEQLDQVSDICLLEDVCPDNLILRVGGFAQGASVQPANEVLDAFGPVAGRTDDCRRGRIEFLAQYPTGDTVKRKQLEDVSALLNSFLPTYSLEYYDLRSGERSYPDGLPQKDRIDPVVVDWIHRAPNHWLKMVSGYRVSGPLGVRPGDIVG
ncbi:hypothetical protein [Methyloligella solikamskensis]|uniref:Uncharacterized protein n=1 Tax=Methyloligella solikamskensis TaxID=1177756 RepID=A0ABW3JBF3_9HYPH